MMQEVIYNIMYVHSYNKHIYKNKIKQIIHNIEYVKYMYQDTFFLFFIFYFFLYVCKVCARGLETETYIQKQNQTSNK